jgi:cellulose synthase/poly-beta-1,6-N-acetylglucosamine synthase-like glycosyltransferase
VTSVAATLTGPTGLARANWPPWLQGFFNALNALGSALAHFLAPVTTPLGRVGREFGIPIGAVLVGLVLGIIAFAAVNWLANRREVEGAGTVPMSVEWPWQEGGRPDPSAPAEPTSTPVQVYGRDGVTTIHMRGAGEHPSLRLPRARGFVFALVGTFTFFAVLLLYFFNRIFAHYDHLVALVGTFLYWPLHWPGIYAVGGAALYVPDYIFPMYLAAMAAFLLASGLILPRPQYAAGRRLLAVAVVLLYIAVEVVLDALLFTVPGSTVRNLGLLVRTLTGGLFVALLTFCAVHLPRPQHLVARFPRDTGAIRRFVAVGLLAIVLSGVLILAVSAVLHFGDLDVPFTLLLLLPVLALPLFAVLARPLYFREIRRRKLPPLSKYHPSVSIVMPAYNEEQWIAGAIRAADRAAGHYPGSVEIIVGSDGSTDRTLELARAAIAQLEHARGFVVDLPHGGKSNALNGALALARGEIVLRCDGDTEISEIPGFGQMIRHFADPEVGGVQGALHPRQKKGWTRKLRALEIAWMHYLLRPASMGTRSAEVIDGLFSAFRRKDLVELGGWVPWNGEDTEMSMRVERLGYRIRIEFGALAFEDVPENYDSLRKQRVRWARGILMANGQHYTSLFGPTPEFCGLAVFFWFLLLIRSGVRSLVYLYLGLLILVLGVPALEFTAVLFAIAILIRAVPLAYFLVRMRRTDVLVWIPFFPFASILKQSFRFEALGTMGPGAAQEYI